MAARPNREMAPCRSTVQVVRQPRPLRLGLGSCRAIAPPRLQRLHGIAVPPLELRHQQLAATAGYASHSATCCRGRECRVASESTKAPPPAKEMGASV